MIEDFIDGQEEEGYLASSDDEGTVVPDDGSLEIVGHIGNFTKERFEIVDLQGNLAVIGASIIKPAEYVPIFTKTWDENRGRLAAFTFARGEPDQESQWSFSFIDTEQFEAQGFHRANGLGRVNHHLCEKEAVDIEQWLQMTAAERKKLLAWCTSSVYQDKAVTAEPNCPE